MAKKLSQSRTVRFNVIMAVVQAVNGSLALLQPILPPQQFVMVAMVVGVVHAAGGVMLRAVTSEPVA